MFNFLSKNSVDEAVSSAYLAARMLEFKGKVDIGEENEKIESLAAKMIAEMEKAEETSLENFSEEAVARYTRIVGEWADAVIFIKELTLSDVKRGEETVASWIASEVPVEAAGTFIPVGDASHISPVSVAESAYGLVTSHGSGEIIIHPATGVPIRATRGTLMEGGIIHGGAGKTYYMHHLRDLAESEDDSFQKQLPRAGRTFAAISKKSTEPDK